MSEVHSASIGLCKRVLLGVRGHEWLLGNGRQPSGPCATQTLYGIVTI